MGALGGEVQRNQMTDPVKPQAVTPRTPPLAKCFQQFQRCVLNDGESALFMGQQFGRGAHAISLCEPMWPVRSLCHRDPVLFLCHSARQAAHA